MRHNAISRLKLKPLMLRTLLFCTSALLAVVMVGDAEILQFRLLQSMRSVPSATECSPSSRLSQPSTSGQVHYVSNSERDSSSGEPSRPFETIQAAVDSASPGDTIYVCAGHYESVVIDRKNGTAQQPIVVAAYPSHESRVTISTDAYDHGAAIKIKDSSYVTVQGFQLSKSLWGIYVTRSHNVTLDSNTVKDIGQEAIRFRGDSSQAKVLNNTISDTGNRRGLSHYGEGIYLGAGSPDYTGEAASEVLIRGNRISNTTAEAIDIKKSVSNVVVEDNFIYNIRTARSGAIVVGINATDESDFTNADNIIIRNNIIQNISRTSRWLDGNGIKAQSSATIEDNQISNYQHRGIFIEQARSDNNFKIYNNELYRSHDTGSHGDIVIHETRARVDLRNNTVRNRDSASE